MRVTVSILMPVRNAAAYICMALDSVAAQTSKDFELIILDGASTDGTQDLIARYGDLVTYTHSQPDKGAVDALNTGVGLARGDYILYLGADDWLAPDTVEKIAIAAQASPDAHVISFGLQEWRQSADELKPLVFYHDPETPEFLLENALYSPCIGRCYSRALYARYGLYKPAQYGHFSDRELQLRFALSRPRKTQVPDVLYHFRLHSGSSTGNAEPRTVVASMRCNRMVAGEYLSRRALNKKERRILKLWYGFSWLREAAYLWKAQEKRGAFGVYLAGFRRYPVACLRTLLRPKMPARYRKQSCR